MLSFDTTPLKRRHLTKKIYILSPVAYAMGWMNIFSTMRTTAIQWYLVIILNFLTWQDVFFTDVTPHPITLKNSLITNDIDSNTMFVGSASSSFLIDFEGVGLSPYLTPYAASFSMSSIILAHISTVVFSMSSIILALSNAPLFSMGHMILTMSCTPSFGMSCIVFAIRDASLLEMSGTIIFLVLLYSFTISNSVFLSLFTVGSIIFSTLLLSLFVVSKIVLLTFLASASFTVSAVSIFASWRFGKLIKWFLDKALSAYFRGKQGELLGSMVEYVHSYHPLRQGGSLGLRSASNTSRAASYALIIPQVGLEG